MLQQACQFHGNFSKSHACTAKDLNSRLDDESLANLCLFLNRIIKENKTVHLLNEPIIEVHSAGISIINRESLWMANLPKVTVAVDVLFLMTVLQLVVFNVKPERLHDTGTCLCVHTQQTGQTGVQFVLWRLGTNSNQSVKGTLAENACKSPGWWQWSQSTQRYLVIQHEQKSAFNIHVTGPFHLETICLLSGGHSVPLKESSDRRLNVHSDENWYTCGAGAQLQKKAGSEQLSNSSHQMFLKWCHTSTKWLSGPYSSLSSSITRLLKKDENFFFCLPGWENKKCEVREKERERGREGQYYLSYFVTSV